MSVKIVLTGDGLSYEKDATVVQAAQIIGFLNNEATQATMPGSRPDNITLLDQPASPRQSARERLLETGAKTNAQKMLVLGDYIMKRDSTDVFLINDVRSCFSKAGEPIPRNFSRDLRDAVRLGYISEDDTQSDHYYVTNKGNDLLNTGFVGDAKPVRHHTKRNGVGQTKVAAISPALAQLNFTDLLESYPNYHALSTKTDKALWILVFAKQNDLDGLVGRDIEYISRQLSDHIPNGQIAAAMRNPLSRGFVSKINGVYRILHSGESYLKAKLSAGTQKG